MKKEQMKQGWLENKNGPWKVRTIEIPTPGPNQVLVKCHAGSICKQTDLNSVFALHPPHDHQCWGMLPHDLRVWDNRLEGDPLAKYYPSEEFAYRHEPYPSRMGHEMSGEIVEIGPVPHSEESFELGFAPKFKIGDRVSGSPIYGGFGEYVLMDVGTFGVFPDSVSYEEGTLIEPVFIVHNTVRQVLEIGDTVVILGQGALGLIATMIAKAGGAGKIVVVEPRAAKRELALKLGADIALDPNEGHIVNNILRLTDGGADTIVEAAGAAETIQILPYIGRQCAKVAQIGAYCNPVYVDWSYIHFKGYKIVSQMQYAMTHVETKWLGEAIRLISSGLIDVRPLITHHYTLDQIGEAFAEAERNPDLIKAVFHFDK